MRNLEQLLSAGLQSVVETDCRLNLSKPTKAADALADAGYQAYLDLKHDPKFGSLIWKISRR